MDKATWCYKCQSSKNLTNYIMTCGHAYCIQCLYRSIFVHHISDIKSADTIKIHCECKESGTIDMTLGQIHELLKQKVVIDSENLNEKEVCINHPTEERNHYCKTCQLCICQQCTKTAEHLDHEIYESEEYAIKFRQFLKNLPLSYKTLDDFVAHFDNLASDFKKEIEDDYAKTVKQIDDLIKSLTALKVDYAKIIKQKLEKGVLVLKIIKMFYCNFYLDFQKREKCNDINVLKYLKDINYEFEDMNLSHNETMFNEIKAIKAKGEELNKSKDQLLDISFNYKEISRDFVSVGKLIGHKQAVTCIIQLQDGRLVTGSGDYTIKFWEEKEGQFVNTITLTEFTGYVLALCQLKDGRIISASRDTSTARVWENVKGHYSCDATLSEHKECINAIIQLSDERVVTASKDKSICIWELNNKILQCKQTLLEHTQGVYVVCEVQNGRIASGSDDNSIRIWDEVDGKFKCNALLSGHTKKVRALCKLKYGKLASGGEDNVIKIWREEKEWYTCIYTVNAHLHGITCIIQLADDRIASCSKDKTIRTWNDTTKGIVKKEVIKAHSHTIFQIIQLSDGRIASAGGDNQVILFKSGVMTE